MKVLSCLDLISGVWGLKSCTSLEHVDLYMMKVRFLIGSYFSLRIPNPVDIRTFCGMHSDLKVALTMSEDYKGSKSTNARTFLYMMKVLICLDPWKSVWGQQITVHQNTLVCQAPWKYLKFTAKSQFPCSIMLDSYQAAVRWNALY